MTGQTVLDPSRPRPVSPDRYADHDHRRDQDRLLRYLQIDQTLGVMGQEVSCVLEVRIMSSPEPYLEVR